MLGQHVADMHLGKLMHETHVQCAVAMAADAVSHLCERIVRHLQKAAPAAAPGVNSMVANALQSINNQNDIGAACERQCTQRLIQTVDRPLLGPDKIRKKHFVFFSIFELIIDTFARPSCTTRCNGVTVWPSPTFGAQVAFTRRSPQ